MSKPILVFNQTQRLCPVCNGVGTLPSHSVFEPMKCLRCDGTGIVTDKKKEILFRDFCK